MGESLDHLVARQPAARELFVYVYCVVAAGDMAIEMLSSPGRTLLQKMRNHLHNSWNRFDVGVMLVSLTGIFVRMLSLLPFFFTRGATTFWLAHNMLVVACGLWMLRVFELLLIWRAIGPYLYMVVRMCKRMLPLVVIILVPLVKFGVVRQAIMKPNITTFGWEQVSSMMPTAKLSQCFISPAHSR